MNDDPLENFRETFLEKMREMTRARLHLNGRTPDQLFDFAYKIVDLLPQETMKAHVVKLSESTSVGDQLKGRQLAILLFAQKEMENCLINLTPDQTAAIAREMGLPF